MMKHMQDLAKIWENLDKISHYFKNSVKLMGEVFLSTKPHTNVPGDGIKRDPERENCAVLTIAAQTANSIHIRVTFNSVTRYILTLLIHIVF